MKPSPSSDDEPVICLGGCGYTLTSDLAKARGYGSRCWKKLHRPPARRPRIPRPISRATPTQPELPDVDQLEIWSP
jgi:hypothetical protein